MVSAAYPQHSDAPTAVRQEQEIQSVRALQRCMLPDVMPNHPLVELDARLYAATEVGGDYYDVRPEGNDRLLLGIGDATGHGLPASMMATSVKTLFQTVTPEEPLTDALARFSGIIRRMNLCGLYMSLSLLRYDAGTLQIATAGMPPALVYRADSGHVEFVVLKGLPLGSIHDFAYADQTVDLAPNDQVLLMSDGLSERFNDAGEMLGYRRIADFFASVAPLPPHTLIEQLKSRSDLWAGGRPAADDMTFLALWQK
ncbi:MAG: SpoIIE family protein phosphatase [Bacteroidetes bacterium]|jgi:sigma-B regulation protein RsbU (phosphoserine phosphatase)|nr:SpoIIE family protein phosphatase [Bacteroidota bacterium]